MKRLTDLGLPLVRISPAKEPPKGSAGPDGKDGKWRRVPQEKWKGILRTERAPESFWDCCVAVQTGNVLPDGRRLYILDIDLKKEEGQTQWAQIIDRYGDPEFWGCPISRTESGGFHLWFASADVHPVQLGLFPGIDFLGLGALSFEPPSRFRQGDVWCNAYEWVVAPGFAEDVPELPRWATSELALKRIRTEAIKAAVDARDSECGSALDVSGLSFVAECLARFTPEAGLEYGQWLRIGMALHDATDGDDAALDVFDAWGARVAAEKAGSYDEKKTRISWDSFGSNRQTRVTLGSLIRILCDDDNVAGFLDGLVDECSKVFPAGEMVSSAKESLPPPNGGESETRKGLANASEAPTTDQNTPALGNNTSTGDNKQEEKGEGKAQEKAATKKRVSTDRKIDHLELSALKGAVLAALGDPVIRTNETNGAIEITVPGEEVRRLDTPTEDKIVLTCLDQGKRLRVLPLQKEKFVLKAINIIADEHKYHPIKEYLRNCLTRYRAQMPIDNIIGGQDSRRYRKKFFEGIGLRPGDSNPITGKTNVQWFEEAFSLWIHGAISKVFHGYQNPMLVLNGPQGQGKSTLAQSLCRDIGEQYFYAGAIDPQDKDHKLKLAQLLVWEPDELGGTTFHADINKLKSLLTLTQCNERPPYGRHVVSMPVVCSFIGTTNDSEFLLDTTGSRRFLVVPFDPVDKFKTIEFLRSPSFSPSLLWGEVFAEIESSGMAIPRYDAEVIREAEIRAEEVRSISDFEDYLGDLFEYAPTEAEFETWHVTRTTLRETILESKVRVPKGFIGTAVGIIADKLNRKKHEIDCWTRDGKMRILRGVKIKGSVDIAGLSKGSGAKLELVKN